jgi:hypothetical protein
MVPRASIPLNSPLNERRREAMARPKKAKVQFKCVHCGGAFEMPQGYLNAYHKKFGCDPKFCSSACFGRAKAVAAETRIEGMCEYCGKPYVRKRKPSGFLAASRAARRFCGIDCHYAWTREHGQLAHLPGYKRRSLRTDGYVEVREIGQRGKPGRWGLEHRVVMEQHLGRRLYPHETVHHRSGDKSDNSIGNLELWSSRHGQGQRVEDKIAFCKSFLSEYGDFAIVRNISQVLPEVKDMIFIV